MCAYIHISHIVQCIDVLQYVCLYNMYCTTCIYMYMYIYIYIYYSVLYCTDLILYLYYSMCVYIICTVLHVYTCIYMYIYVYIYIYTTVYCTVLT